MSAIVDVDARRLLCPMPVIRLQDRIESLPAGSEVRITCTDPGTQNDIPAWCRINGHRVVSVSQRQDDYIFLVRKGNDGN
jgi:tRNA 2-thiouridine synthesizing protein A